MPFAAEQFVALARHARARVLLQLSEHLVRHRAAFVEQLTQRAGVLRAQFGAIDALKYRPTFEKAALRGLLEALRAG
ncbi:MAG: hypothetical protein ACKVQU_25330 [Burkholderiales bacterium]